MSEPERRVMLERYSANVRTNHWTVALLFVLAALSGLALFHPALYWLSALFGGGPWTRILHPFAGVLMVVAFAVLAASVFRDNLRSEEHTSELQSREKLVCRLLLEKKYQQ